MFEWNSITITDMIVSLLYYHTDCLSVQTILHLQQLNEKRSNLRGVHT